MLDQCAFGEHGPSKDINIDGNCSQKHLGGQAVKSVKC